MQYYTCKGNGQALSLPMHEMGRIPNANTSTDSHKKRQPLFLLGGKAPTDPEIWTPNMDAVRATIKFAISTGRLDMDVEQAANTPQ
jgi:hypothetical protein